MATSYSGQHAVSNQCSCHMPGPISEWMGDCLWAGKPSRKVTSKRGRIRLLPSAGWQNVSFLTE